MKISHFAGIFVVAAVLLALVLVMGRKEEKDLAAGETKIGNEIFKSLPVNDISKIEIDRKGSKLVLVKKNDKWTLESLYDYPADFAKIRDFISEIAEIKNVQNVDAGKSGLSRLGLDPSAKDGEEATSLAIFTSDGKKLSSFIIGKEHKKKSNSEEGYDMEFADGRYFREDGKDLAHVVDKTFSEIAWPSKDWADRDFISAKDFKKASYEEGGQIRWTVSREKKEDQLKPQTDPPEGHEIDKDKMSSIGNALYSIRFSSPADPSLKPADTGLDSPGIFRAETFSGKKYELKIGKPSENMKYVKISVSYEKPNLPELASLQEAPKDEDAKAKEAREKKLRDLNEELKKAEEESKSEQDKFGAWTYLIADASLKAMSSKAEELFKKPASKDEAKGSNPPPPMPPEGMELPSNLPMPPPTMQIK